MSEVKEKKLKCNVKGRTKKTSQTMQLNKQEEENWREENKIIIIK